MSPSPIFEQADRCQTISFTADLSSQARDTKFWSRNKPIPLLVLFEDGSQSLCHIRHQEEEEEEANIDETYWAEQRVVYYVVLYTKFWKTAPKMAAKG